MKLTQRTVNKIESGEICVFCHVAFIEQYDEPKACEECGGDGVLATYENTHQGY